MNVLKRLCKSMDGSVGLAFAVASVALLTCIGVVVDATNMYKIAGNTQAALDTAVLATASVEGSQTSRISVGQQTYADNIHSTNNIKALTPKISIGENGVVFGTAEVSYKTLIMGMFGNKTVTISKQAQTNTGQLNNAEIVLVLDYSSSMQGQYEPMRDAAISFINTITKNGAQQNIKLGLVPFAGEAYVTVPGNYATTGILGTPWSNCTTGRRWPSAVADSTPSGSNDSKWGRLGGNETPTAEDYQDTCQSYTDNNLIVRPLTADHAGTITQLQLMRPHSGTNIAIAMAIGYQLISPKPPWTEGSAYDSNWQKIIILMSDGQHNKNEHGPGGIFTADQGSANVNTLCQNIKNDGVLILSIGYELNSANAIQQLRTCASDEKYALTGDQNNINDVFKQIGGLLITSPYLVH